jgi:hypothetical protein
MRGEQPLLQARVRSPRVRLLEDIQNQAVAAAVKCSYQVVILVRFRRDVFEPKLALGMDEPGCRYVRPELKQAKRTITTATYTVNPVLTSTLI